MDSKPPIRRSDLVLPFAALGLFGGWFAASCYDVDPFVSRKAPRGGFDNLFVGWGLLLITPAVAALLGKAFAPAARGRAPRTFSLLLCAALAAGAANGAAMGVLAEGGVIGLAIGLLWGAACGLPFVPALALVVLAARSIGRARAGSVLDASDRRRVWSATATAIALSVAPFTLAWGPKDSAVHLGAKFTLYAVPVLLLLFACDTRALLQARRGVKELDAVLLVPAGPLEKSEKIVDFGLGEGAQGKLVAGSYRFPEHVRAVFIGDPRAVRAHLQRSLAVSFAGLGLVACVVFATWRR